MGRKNKNKHKKQNIKQQPRLAENKEQSLEVIEPEVVIEVIEPVMSEPVITQQQMVEQPVMNGPIMSQQQVVEQPVMNGPIMSQQQVVEQPVMNVPAMPQQPVVEQPVMNGPIMPQQQVVEQPVMNVPAMTQQVVEQPAMNGPVMPQQVVEQPVMNGPVMPQQVVEQPVMNGPVMPQQQVVEQPVMMQQPVETKHPKKMNLLITKHPKSSFSESIKSIRTNLQFSAVEKEIKVILVSSPEPGDGKSMISSNLAGAYAQENKKVLIIDCDLRKGRQAEIFGVKKTNTTGYTNLILKYNDPDLDTQTELEDYICKTDIENVDLIPNGPTPPNPIELLSSSRNKELIDDLKEIYDIIILDCPPVLGLSDALVMTKYSDANIIVISKGKTKVESLLEVKKSFEKVNSVITGVVTNKAKAKHNSYYGYYGD